MNFFKKHIALLTGTGLILLTNAIVLGGVAYNYSGSPQSHLTLSERELSYFNYDHDDNSGIAVNLQWKVLSQEIINPQRKVQSYDWYNYSREAYWLTDAKLRELGFDITTPAFPVEGSYRYKQLQDREVFLVLEQNGPSYQRYLEQAKLLAKEATTKEEAVRQVKAAESEVSRLFVVDAGNNPDELRKRYPDGAMYAITKGIIGANWQSGSNKPVLNAHIKELSVSSLHVSKPHDAVFVGQSYATPSARYQVNVAYGQRYEPWITGAKRTR